MTGLVSFPPSIQVHLEHLVLSHQGERAYGSPVEPMSAEALVLHFIDNLDSKLNQFRAAGELGIEFQYVRGIGRHIYVPGAEPATESPADEAPPPVPETLSLFESGS